MKYISSMAVAMLLNNGVEGYKLSEQKNHGSSWEKDFVQIGLRTNNDLMSEVEQKMAKVVNLVQVKKLEEACDAACQATCDKDADEMIKEMKNPLNNITWNCKNNYDVYTTDYDPDHSHFDRISSDVMDVQRTLWQIKHLEEKQKKPWTWKDDERDSDFAVLKELKKQLGLPTEGKIGD